MIRRVVETAATLAGQPGRVVLLSGRSARGLGQLSAVAADPEAVITGTVGDIFVRERDGSISTRGVDPYQLIADRLARSPELTAIGYLGYDMGAAASGVQAWPTDPRREPDLWFGLYAAVWMLDHETGEERVAGPDSARLQDAMKRPAELGTPPRFGELVAGDGVDEAYRRGFANVIDYLHAGDCYQVNLSRRLEAPLTRSGDALALFAQLCERNPEPYAALIETGTHSIISGSPERFLYRAAGSSRLETRPIKGTRARSGDPVADAAAREALTSSEKEAAEHLMIVDLERNDLGRLAQIGSVRVEELAAITELPTLFHMESIVACDVRPDVGVGDILRATFPGGSITGAPKLRSMEIIRELEPSGRGVYTGAIGMLGPRGAVDLAIAIRTAVVCESSLSLHVGGGVVADSQLEREFVETEEKAAGWRRALASSAQANNPVRAIVSR